MKSHNWHFRMFGKGFFFHASYDPRRREETSSTQQSLVGCWSNCLFHQSPEDITKWATEEFVKTAAPPSASHLPSSSAACLFVSSQWRGQGDVTIYFMVCKITGQQLKIEIILISILLRKIENKKIRPSLQHQFSTNVDSTRISKDH